MIIIEHSVGPSQYGLGLFTKVALKKGQLVMDADNRLDVIISKAELSTYPKVMQKHYEMYSYAGNGKYRLSDALYYNTDNTRFINHADTPNLIYDSEDECYYASSDIEAGTELTCDYNDFCERGDLCFSF